MEQPPQCRDLHTARPCKVQDLYRLQQGLPKAAFALAFALCAQTCNLCRTECSEQVTELLRKEVCSASVIPLRLPWLPPHLRLLLHLRPPEAAAACYQTPAREETERVKDRCNNQ
jgi:hypothetical protein